MEIEPERSSPARRIRHEPSGPADDGAASERSSLNGPIRPPAESPEDQPAGGPPAFGPEQYKARNVVERRFSRFKQFRAVATGFDKSAARCLAGPRLASLILWPRKP